MLRYIPVSLILALVFCNGATAAEPPVITFGSLLDEMVDRAAMARWPDPPFTLHQASSYDRRSKTPGNADWFANVDWSNFIRTEKVKTADGERTEHVMLDAAGPGAIVRIWVGGYTDRGNIRFYIDGAAEPVLTGTADELIGGNKVFPKPFADTRARGRNLYAPIPYAKQIKVTYDGPLPAKFGNPGQEGFWYNINYRTYPAGTKVESFSTGELKRVAEKLTAGGKRLLDPLGDGGRAGRDVAINTAIAPGILVDMAMSNGPAAICTLDLTVAENETGLLRQCAIEITFDGHRSVYCPIEDFFGSTVGGTLSHDWWRTVRLGGVSAGEAGLKKPRLLTMSCYWPMPYKQKFHLRVLCPAQRAQQDVNSRFVVATRLSTQPWQWDARSLYFHAGFRRNPAIDTSKKSDFNYVTVKGRGVYMGDTLSLFNPVPNWWGEGDEKIFVDGEKFPSHFGTGSEDYYGYAWGNTDVFNSPFHSQPRAGAKNQGHTTNSRVRMLDRIPFSKSLQMDMEVWHSRPTKVDYSVATFWYGDADNTSNASTDEKLLAPGSGAK